MQKRSRSWKQTGPKRKSEVRRSDPEDETGIEPEPEIMSQPETIPDTSEETVQASLAERIIEWLESHITTITVSFVSVLLLAAGIWLFVKSGKKPGRQSP